MADTDLIARVYPSGKFYFELAQNMIKTSSRCMPPKIPQQLPRETPQNRGTRESTAPLETRVVDPDTLPYIELRFSDGPRTSSGFVFGKDPEASDIVLPDDKHISRRHFALTYNNKFDDGRYRLIVRDLGSTCGTIVTYDNEGGELRSNFDWTIDGFSVPNRKKQVIIEVPESLQLRVIVNHHHNTTSPTYVENVERFRQGVAGTLDLFGVLDIQTGPETERRSQVYSPVRHPFTLSQGWIAQGGFGAVSRRWDVSTGKEYARKQPIGKTYDRKS